MSGISASFIHMSVCLSVCLLLLSSLQSKLSVLPWLLHRLWLSAASHGNVGVHHIITQIIYVVGKLGTKLKFNYNDSRTTNKLWTCIHPAQYFSSCEIVPDSIRRICNMTSCLDILDRRFLFHSLSLSLSLILSLSPFSK